jgi:hypothetical protein
VARKNPFVDLDIWSFETQDYELLDRAVRREMMRRISNKEVPYSTPVHDAMERIAIHTLRFVGKEIADAEWRANSREQSFALRQNSACVFPANTRYIVDFKPSEVARAVDSALEYCDGDTDALSAMLSAWRTALDKADARVRKFQASAR